MYYRIISDEDRPSCLECGNEFHGRSDKRFCSIGCKNAYNNRRAKSLREYRNSIMKSISRNYEILEMLLREKISTISLDEIGRLGFELECVTGHRAGKHNEYACYDIRYFRSETKIFNIHRVEVPVTTP